MGVLSGNRPGITCCGFTGEKACRGAVTVEYAMVFPVVLFVLMLLIYFGLLYYQQALMQSVVSANAQDWAFLWGYDARKVVPGEGVLSLEGYQSEGLYWQLFSGAATKKETIKAAILKDYQEKSLLKASRDVQVDVTYDNYLLVQNVGVRITAEYPLPIKGFFRAVGLSGDIRLQAYSRTTVHDPKEFIHNVDFLLQIYEESGAKDWVAKTCKPLTDALKKVRDYFKPVDSPSDNPDSELHQEHTGKGIKEF